VHQVGFIYKLIHGCTVVAYPGILFGGGGSTNSVENRESGDLGAVAPESGVLEAAVIWYKKFHFI
jgi:hypothetical protein